MPLSLRIYEAALTATFAGLVVVTVAGGRLQHVAAFLLFTVYIVAIEYSDLNFYDERSRLGLSASEAIFLPMLIALTPEELFWGIALGVAAREAKRIYTLKGRFNVSQYSLSAMAGAAIWAMLRDPSMGILTPRNLTVLIASVLVFSVLTHVLTSVAIALSERRPFFSITGTALWETITNLAGSIVLGLLFAAAYIASPWMALFFPLVLGVFFVGYKAFLGQGRERERLEKLHEATRALAAGRDLHRALEGFLRAVQDAISARRSAVILRDGAGDAWLRTEVDGRVVVAKMEPTTEGPMAELTAEVLEWDESVILTQDEQGSNEMLSRLNASALVATPLKGPDDVEGVVVVMDRVGADEFEDHDLRLLAALGDELVVTLGSYRLFQEVVEERERFGRIFTGSKEGICLLDGVGCVKAWNPALERITGYKSDEVMNKIWSDVLTIRDRQEDRVRGDELVGVEADEELELVTKAGPSRWVTLLAGPVGDAEDGGWVVLMRDVTAEHEVESAKSDFLSTISHELRTPLTTIKGSLQVLSRGPENLPPDLAGQMIGVTTRGAERLERLVMNLLAVSQIESGTMPVFPDALDLEAIVKERMSALLKDHHQTTFEGAEKPIIVRADRERMSHVVEHLLENAQKFGGPEGEIRIAISHDAGFARLSITDQGPGIATGDHEKIFERFLRLGDVLTRETQGAGIGLFIAKRSVEAMGGRIWVESKLGEGSTFHVTIPMARPMAVADEADSA